MRNKLFLLAVLTTLTFTSFSSTLYASYDEGIDSMYVDEIFMQIGELERVKVHSLTRVSITKPNVADVESADEKQIVLIAKSVGETVLFIWDEHGKRTLTVHVISEDLDMISSRIQALFDTAEIKGLTLNKNMREKRLVITGKTTTEKKSMVQEIISPFASNVLDLSGIYDVEDLIQIDIQVTELNETLQKALGIKWTTAGNDNVLLSYPESVPSFDGSVGDLFKIGDFTRTSQLLAAVEASIVEGKGRVLSKPRLVVKSGEDASFLVGGQIPIRSTTTTSTAAVENTTYKDYGISMTITPKISRHNKVDVTLSVQISDIDGSAPVDGDVAFVTRTADTKLLMEDQQTIVMAGLIRKAQSTQISKIPLLGSIPVLGALFRHKSSPSADQDTELVISMTPSILSDYDQLRTVKKEEKATTPSQKRVEQKIAAPKLVQEKSATNSISDEMSDYIQEVQKKISQSITYPKEAQEFGWEGTVKVGLHILSDGTLAFALVKESSGHELFDQNALTIAKSIAPYSKFPAGTQLQELNVTIPIVYSLQKN